MDDSLPPPLRFTHISHMHMQKSIDPSAQLIHDKHPAIFLIANLKVAKVVSVRKEIMFVIIRAQGISMGFLTWHHIIPHII